MKRVPCPLSQYIGFYTAYINFRFLLQFVKGNDILIWGNYFFKSVEEKLSLAQEDLISNRNQIGNQNKLIQELKAAKATLEQDSAKKEQQLKEQSKALQDIQKEKVFQDFNLKLPSENSFRNRPCRPLILLLSSPVFSTVFVGDL